VSELTNTFPQPSPTSSTTSLHTPTSSESFYCKLNPEVKTAWVEALRSGEYRQCSSRLTNENEHGERSFCCLGVLADLYAQAHGYSWIIRGDDVDVEYNLDDKVFYSYSEFLPRVVREWAGTLQEDIVISHVPEEGDPEGEPLTASMANDELNMSFAQIADLIELHL
jgi:hypothetical protein